ncbi:MAG: Tm-1-like ATP-binding domain-containing protein [Chloroflexota bacterium]
MSKNVVLIGTLDTKGPEIAYLRDRCQQLGLQTTVLDSGILGEPLDIEPDISRATVAEAAGSSLEAIRNAGSRGAAVHEMMKGVRNIVVDLYAKGQLQGTACLGGAEGAVLGAHAMQALPVGVPKIVATPIASGTRHFGPLIGLRDVMVIHSIIDILGLNPISTTIFDNIAAALSGMIAHGRILDLETDQRYVAITMLGNTTKSVMGAKERLAEAGIEAIIFHSNGVGGPAMEELAEQGLFIGVIDFTTDELTDELVGGFHNGGPQRLRVVGRLGLPQVIVPGCIDFSVHGPPEAVPAGLKDRPMYTHNPVFTLVRTLKSEMDELGHRFAERLNKATGPTKIAYPTQGLSIPSYPPDGVFWDPEADAAFMQRLRSEIRDDIPILEYERHVNDPEFGVEMAELFLEML